MTKKSSLKNYNQVCIETDGSLFETDCVSRRRRMKSIRRSCGYRRRASRRRRQSCRRRKSTRGRRTYRSRKTTCSRRRRMSTRRRCLSRRRRTKSSVKLGFEPQISSFTHWCPTIGPLRHRHQLRIKPSSHTSTQDCQSVMHTFTILQRATQQVGI